MEVSLQSFKKRFTYDPQKDLLGKGGFGEVYKAYDTEDHIFVALKISQGTTDDKYNLINEIKRFKKLSHPNIVKHIEAYEVNTGSSDIHGKPIAYHVGILEYANNGTLADLLKKGTPDYRIIEDLAKDIIEGLAYLHSENIIHRDLKPTNILLFSEGEKLRAKITDFGIAKRTDATAASTQLVGTVEYMAPEFFSTGNITPAADVWSVGVMLLEALTGTHPFGKTTQGLSNEQIINNILNKDLGTATQNLLPPFKEIITRCLLRETNLRPQSAAELKGLLQQSGDTFSEKTQVIDTKQKATVTEKSKSRWRRWVAALFDFDVRDGKWKKILAREFLLILFVVVITPTSYFFVMTSFYFIKKPIVKEASKNAIHQVYQSLTSNNTIELSPIATFERRYNNLAGYSSLFNKLEANPTINENQLKELKGIYTSDIFHYYHGDYDNLFSFLSSSIYPRYYSSIESWSESSNSPIIYLTLLFSALLFPLRFFIILIFSATKILGFTFPSITKTSSKAIKYSLSALIIILFGGCGYYLFNLYHEANNHPSEEIFDFSDAPINERKSEIIPPLPKGFTPIVEDTLPIIVPAKNKATNEQPPKIEYKKSLKPISLALKLNAETLVSEIQKYLPCTVDYSHYYHDAQGSHQTNVNEITFDGRYISYTVYANYYNGSYFLKKYDISELSLTISLVSGNRAEISFNSSDVLTICNVNTSAFYTLQSLIAAVQ